MLFVCCCCCCSCCLEYFVIWCVLFSLFVLWVVFVSYVVGLWFCFYICFVCFCMFAFCLFVVFVCLLVLFRTGNITLYHNDVRCITNPNRKKAGYDHCISKVSCDNVTVTGFRKWDCSVLVLTINIIQWSNTSPVVSVQHDKYLATWNFTFRKFIIWYT